MLNDPAPRQAAFLKRHELASEDWFFNRKLGYKERVFEGGQTVSVLGTARWEQDPDPNAAGLGYRDAPKRLVIEAGPSGPVLMSSDPRARGETGT